MLKNKFIKNLSWIFVGNILHAILQYLINIIAARILTTSDYGIINYSATLITFFTSIGTLGFNYTITKKFADDEENSEKYIGTTILPRVIFSVLAILTIQILVRISDPQDSTLHLVTFCQSITIFLNSFDIFVYWFRYKNQANVVAIVRLVAFFFSATLRLGVLFVSKSIVLYVVGVIIESFLYMLLLVFSYIKRKYPKPVYRQNIFKQMLRHSYPFIFSALLSTIYGQTDKIMLKAMLGVDAVAHYSVSLTLAGAISIIPITLIDGFRPEIMKYKISDEELYKRRFRQLYALVFWMCIAYCVFVTLFAKDIILILYGEKYLPAVGGMAVIVWYTSFSYFGAINNIYMVCENKTFWVQITTFIGALVNIVLNFALIPIYGLVGAAMASLMTQILINFLLLALVPSLRPCFFLMFEGMILKDTFNFKKIFRKRGK